MGRVHAWAGMDMTRVWNGEDNRFAFAFALAYDVYRSSIELIVCIVLVAFVKEHKKLIWWSTSL